MVEYGGFKANSTTVFKSVEEYVKSVEHFRALIGKGDEIGLSRETVEAELEKRNVWKDYGEVRNVCQRLEKGLC